MGLPTDAQVQRVARLRAAVVAQLMGVSSRSTVRNNITAVQIPVNNRLAVLRATVQQCTFCLDGQTSDRGATGPDKCYVSSLPACTGLRYMHLYTAERGFPRAHQQVHVRATGHKCNYMSYTQGSSTGSHVTPHIAAVERQLNHADG
jgi:hypothetical protein